MEIEYDVTGCLAWEECELCLRTYDDCLPELMAKVSRWGVDRNITEEGGATVKAQLDKLVEELNEGFCTLEAVASTSPTNSLDLEVLHKQLDDDFGDMLVCLIQAMRLANTDMVTCLEKAWGDIKDRKGTMVDGKFVKES